MMGVGGFQGGGIQTVHKDAHTRRMFVVVLFDWICWDTLEWRNVLYREVHRGGSVIGLRVVEL